MTFKHSLVVLDRDGIVNIDHGYVAFRKDFTFTPGIFELCKIIQNLGGTLVIATNQSGIARGYYSDEDFQILTSWMVEVFESEGVKISQVYYCPHLDGNTNDRNMALESECDCRKPKPGMLTQAFADWGSSLTRAYMIGDKDSDMLAAKRAGYAHRILIGSADSEHKTRSFKNTAEALKEIGFWYENLQKAPNKNQR